MEHGQRPGLDNPALNGRIRTSRSAFVYNRPHARPVGRVDGFHAPLSKQHQPVPALNQVQVEPAAVPVQVHSNTSPTRHPSRPVATKPQPNLPRQSKSIVLHRQAVHKVVPKKYRPKKYRRPLLPTLVTALAVVLFSFGAFAAISSLRTVNQAKTQVKGLASTHPSDDGITDGLPSEDEPPADLSSYMVAADLPRFFNVQKLGVHARVRRLGIGNNNILKSPANIYDVGWYDGSAKPGESGTLVIDGHVSGPSKRGVFYNIGGLVKGDKVSIERGDGKVINYTVTGTQVYENDKVDMTKVMASSVPGKSAMNFMTCTGRYNVRTNQYEQRVVVFTVQD